MELFLDSSKLPFLSLFPIMCLHEVSPLLNLKRLVQCLQYVDKLSKIPKILLTFPYILCPCHVTLIKNNKFFF